MSLTFLRAWNRATSPAGREDVVASNRGGSESKLVNILIKLVNGFIVIKHKLTCMWDSSF